jgi:hypothetical protein
MGFWGFGVRGWLINLINMAEKFQIQFEIKDDHVNFVCKTKDGRVNYQHPRPTFD